MSLGHYLPIFLAALAAFLIGAVWYSPLLFAKAWVRVHGYTEEALAAMRAKAPKTYTASFVAFLVMAAVFHIILAHLGVESASAGASWGFHLWLGIAAPIGFTANLYSDKPIAAFLIDTGYQLAYLLAMGAILGVGTDRPNRPNRLVRPVRLPAFPPLLKTTRPPATFNSVSNLDLRCSKLLQHDG